MSMCSVLWRNSFAASFRLRLPLRLAYCRLMHAPVTRVRLSFRAIDLTNLFDWLEQFSPEALTHILILILIQYPSSVA